MLIGAPQASTFLTGYVIFDGHDGYSEVQVVDASGKALKWNSDNAKYTNGNPVETLKTPFLFKSEMLCETAEQCKAFAADEDGDDSESTQCRCDACLEVMQECHATDGVHLIEVPVDYSENDKILNNDIRELSAAI